MPAPSPSIISKSTAGSEPLAITMGIPASVKTIDISAFEGCNGLKTIYYGGQEADWDNIAILEGNEILQNVEIVYGNAKAPVPTFDEETGEVIESVDEDNVANTENPTGPQEDSNILWIVIIVVAAVLVVGAGVVVVIVLKRKKNNT